MDTAQAARPNDGPSNARRRNPRWINVKRGRTRVGGRDHHTTGRYASSETRRRRLISTPTPPLMQFMKYVVPAALSLVTIKYQGKTESLFLQNPAPLWCFVVATCVYWLIVGAMMTSKGKCFREFGRAALAFGILSAVSLLSIFLPDSVSLVPLMIWLPFLPLVLAWPCAYTLLDGGKTSVVDKIHGIVVWVRGCKSTEEVSLPV